MNEITIESTKGTKTFTTLRAACDYLEEYQPGFVVMTVNGEEVDFDFDAVKDFDADQMMRDLNYPFKDALGAAKRSAARTEYDVV